MEDKEYLFEAARILKECPRKRLPAVIELLKRAGIDIEEAALESCDERRVPSTQEKRGKKRASAYSEEFWKSDDAFVQRMRDAFAEGVSFTRVSEMTGLSRVSLYRYLHGKSTPNKDDAERVLTALDSLCAPKM